MDEMIQRLMDQLSAANERREAAVTARKAILDSADAEKRTDLSEEEDAQFRVHTDEIRAVDTEIADLDVRVTELQDEKVRTETAQRAGAKAKAYQPQAQVTDEPLTYAKRNGKSYIRDLTQATLYQDAEARERLARHASEVKEAPEFAELRAAAPLTRVDGFGGFFVPPAWLMGQWIELARPGRPTANLVTSLPLPPGTDSINIPKVATGTAAANVQNGDGTAVTDGSWTDTSIAIPVRTVAGQQTLAQQLLDQSPLNFDEIIFRDLLADYAVKVDTQVLSGATSNGEVTGFLTQPNIISVAATAVTGIGVYSAVANATQQVHAARFQSPQVIVMHPRRWAWLQVQVDANGRPLVLPRAYTPTNAMGEVTQLAYQGPVGDMMGLPVVLDPSIPTNLQANGTTGGTEDRILILRPDDDLLYESSIRSRVLPEVKAQNLQIVVQIYGYLAFSAARYPAGTAAISGLTTPAF